LAEVPGYIYTQWHELRAWQWGHDAIDPTNPLMKGMTRMMDAEMWAMTTTPTYNKPPVGTEVPYDPLGWGLTTPQEEPSHVVCSSVIGGAEQATSHFETT
jgi:hypothetical protein